MGGECTYAAHNLQDTPRSVGVCQGTFGPFCIKNVFLKSTCIRNIYPLHFTLDHNISMISLINESVYCSVYLSLTNNIYIIIPVDVYPVPPPQ